MRYFWLACVLVFSLVARADDMSISANGTIAVRNNLPWIKVGSNYYLLTITDPDMQLFALALNNKSVHIDGWLEVRQGVPVVHALRLLRGGTGTTADSGYTYGMSAGGGNGYRGTGVIFPNQTPYSIPSYNQGFVAIPPPTNISTARPAR